MRTVKIGGADVELRGSALAPLTWYSAFGDDGLYDAMVRIEKTSPARPAFPMRDVLRLAWVLAHDADVAAGREPCGFEAWVASHAQVDFSVLKEAAMGEARDAFFPSVVEAARQAAAKRRRKAGVGAVEGVADGDGKEDEPVV